MSTAFRYRAIDSSGCLVTGNIRGITIADVHQSLVESGLTPVEIAPAASGLWSRRRASGSDVEQFTGELAMLLDSGVQIDQALQMLVEGLPPGQLQDGVADLLDGVRSGRAVHECMAKHEQLFPALYCQTVRIGESTGRLAETFRRLADNLRFENELKAKLTQAMVYPGFILCVCVLSIWAVFNFIVPSMSGIFAGIDELPSYTQALLDISAWFRAWQYHLLAAIVAGAVTLTQIWSKPEFQSSLQAMVIKMPLIGGGLLMAERIRFASSMQLMLASGLNLAPALEHASGLARSERLRQQLVRAHQQVSSGSSLAAALQGSDVVEPLMLSLIKVGEESGRMEAVFAEIARRARQRFEAWTMRLTAIVEPLMIVVMGGVVGSVVVTMLLSIVSINDVSL